MLFAQAVELGIFDAIAQLGAVTIVSGLLIYMLVYHGPRQEAHRLKAETRWIETLEKRDTMSEKQRGDFTLALAEQRDHDRTKHDSTNEKVGGLTDAMKDLVLKIDNCNFHRD
ncbi:MAG: hypothetical protein GY759_09155 [Chloroflexi bacterium]|nr:hypothetical protein [Chloroflexota bacterium]